MKSLARMRFDMLVPFLYLLVLAACADQAPLDTAQVDLPASMDIVSGDIQSAPAGTRLPSPVVVRVLNAHGRPISNQIINWHVTEGGGSTFAGTSLTSDVGIAQELWTLGPAPGRNRLEARAVDSTTGQPRVFAVFTAEGLPPIAAVTVSPDSLYTTQVGVTTQLQATAVDQSGNSVAPTFSWTSLNPAVVSVTSSGLITAQGYGTAHVIVAAGDRADTAVAVVDSAQTSPPSSSTGEPIYQSGDRSYFSDGFEDYANTSQLLTWQSVHRNRWLMNAPTGIELVSSGARSGTKAVRFTFVAGTAQQSHLIEAMSPEAVGADPSSLVVTFWIRTMPGYEWTNQTGNTHKIFLMRIGTGGDRVAIFFGREPLTPSMPAYGSLQEERPNVSIGSYNFNQNLNYPAVRTDGSLNDGQWHRVTTRLTKPINGSGTGRAEMWVDGTKIIEYLGDDPTRPEYGLVNVPADALAPNFHFPSVMNAAPSRTQWIEYDDVRIWSR